MKLGLLGKILVVGLALKAAALIGALFVGGPGLPPVAQPVAAQEAAQPAPAAQEAAQEPAPEGQPPAEGAQEPAAPPPSQPANYDPRLIELLDQKKKKLALEEERLQQERKELQKLREEVNGRIVELQKVQTALEGLIDQQNKARQERIEQLVKVLGNMRPQPAADVISKLDLDMSVEIFRRMNSRTAGKVMASLEPERAAQISTLLTQQQKSEQAAKVARDAAAAGAEPAE
ncbi:MgtE intracellular region [Desulfarculus baarsii DSM 2075]|uniref:MgtE intracellular region n=1 Tax=Desulfarculus baarsii (strain ATCC 33931 / DSM 2075 / LMG 7858 / VKM B-1802 / 2st14) TaxID=644282 RepID=E1QFF1_DESB2|nr:MgtE integral membrane protein [Desulfarculus baarsii]ADK84287.1 MgtE intracellular region [Desulfarculus baarsii DSM 2075]